MTCDFNLTAFVTQLNDLTTKISEVENQCKSKGRYIPPYDRVRSRSNEDKCIEDGLLIIHQKPHAQDKMLEAMKENMEVLRQMCDSYSRPIKFIKDLMDHTLTHLYASIKDDYLMALGLTPEIKVN